MLKSLHLAKFKCFLDQTFELRPLNLLIGCNGNGKSTLIQALLLLQQRSQQGGDFVKLNGISGLRLGSFRDIVNYGMPDESEIHIHSRILEQATSESHPVGWTLTAESPDETAAFVSCDQPEHELKFLKMGFHYLQAERLGPREVYDMESAPSTNSDTGTQGEFTAHQIVKMEKKKKGVPIELRHPGYSQEFKNFRQQIEFWLRDISPEVEIRSLEIPDTNLVKLRISRGGLKSEWVRPYNFGFGISYALPIYVAGLSAEKGSLFIVENPEAHLHPAAQTKMGLFLARLAAYGVQVVVETHSDHIINGIRLACLRKNEPLTPQDVFLYFFDLSLPNQVQTITLNEKAEFSEYPQGFFDQTDYELAEILRLRHQR